MTGARIAVSILLLTSIAPDRFAPPDRPSALREWKAVPKPLPGSAEMFCGNYSRRRWQVTASDDGISVAQRFSTPPAALPFGVDPAVLGIRKGARRHALRVDDGWLLGFDAGEYGGGLWWFDDAGAINKRLYGHNILGIFPFGSERVAITGLAHLSTDTGRVLRVTREGPHRWRAIVWLDLGATPQAFAIDPKQDAVVFATTRGVARLDLSGEVHWLAKGEYQSLYPRSVAVLASGEIYVGMNLFIVRLAPVPAGYHEEWLVPPECARFEVNGLDCVCHAK